MKHVMVDLETLGTVPGCVILSIGAVEFDPVASTLGKEFYTVISQESCEEHFLEVDAATVAWWDQQGAEARTVLEAARAPDAPTLVKALDSFNSYLAGLSGPKGLRVYGNGADFDNPILASAYRAANRKQGWASYGGRCYRTLKKLDELLGDDFAAPKLARAGTHHNALDDAKSQALHLMEIVSGIKENK